MGTRIVQFSKRKILLVIGGSIALIAVGLWLADLDPTDHKDAWFWSQYNPQYVHGVGVIACIFSGLCALLGVMKMFDRRPGLILGDDGFTDNSGATGAGFVSWSEVTGLSVFQIKRQRSLVVKVADQDRYINRGNVLRRILKRFSAGMCGSPIVISSTALLIGFDELFALFESYWKTWKNVSQEHCIDRSCGTAAAAPID